MPALLPSGLVSLTQKAVMKGVGGQLWAENWPTQRLVLRSFGIRDLRANAIECVSNASDLEATWRDTLTRKAMISAMPACDNALSWLLRLMEAKPILRTETWKDLSTRTAVLAAASAFKCDRGDGAMAVLKAWASASPVETFHDRFVRDVVSSAAYSRHRKTRESARSTARLWDMALPIECKSEFGELCKDVERLPRREAALENQQPAQKKQKKQDASLDALLSAL